jgi:hypothetical protein
MRPTAGVWFGTLLLFGALARGGAQPPQQACDPWQSPRSVKTDHTVRESIVVDVRPDQKEASVQEPGKPTRHLVLCGQHYHAPVENVQGCAGETDVISAPPARAGDPPSAGQWIEVHTVYAPRVDAECDRYKYQTLGCCLGVTAHDPALVRAFSAKVAPGPPGPVVPATGLPALIRTPAGRPLAEWSGSNTGWEAIPGECLKTPVIWSFRLVSDCNVPFRIARTDLEGFSCPQPDSTCQPSDPKCKKEAIQKCGWQGARSLQAGPRVSTDLRRVLAAE